MTFAEHQEAWPLAQQQMHQMAARMTKIRALGGRGGRRRMKEESIQGVRAITRRHRAQTR